MFGRSSFFTEVAGVVIGRGMSFEYVVRRGAPKTIATRDWHAIKRQSTRKPRFFYIDQNMGVNGFWIWPHGNLGITDPYMNPKYYGLKIYFKRVRVCRTISPPKMTSKNEQNRVFLFSKFFSYKFSSDQIESYTNR